MKSLKDLLMLGDKHKIPVKAYHQKSLSTRQKRCKKKNHADFLHTFVLEHDDAQSQNSLKFISLVVRMNLSYTVRQIHGACSIFLLVHPLEEPGNEDRNKTTKRCTKALTLNFLLKKFHLQKQKFTNLLEQTQLVMSRRNLDTK